MPLPLEEGAEAGTALGTALAGALVASEAEATSALGGLFDAPLDVSCACEFVALLAAAPILRGFLVLDNDAEADVEADAVRVRAIGREALGSGEDDAGVDPHEDDGMGLKKSEMDLGDERGR